MKIIRKIWTDVSHSKACPFTDISQKKDKDMYHRCVVRIIINTVI